MNIHQQGYVGDLEFQKEKEKERGEKETRENLFMPGGGVRCLVSWVLMAPLVGYLIPAIGFITSTAVWEGIWRWERVCELMGVCFCLAGMSWL